MDREKVVGMKALRSRCEGIERDRNWRRFLVVKPKNSSGVVLKIGRWACRKKGCLVGMEEVVLKVSNVGLFFFPWERGGSTNTQCLKRGGLIPL